VIVLDDAEHGAAIADRAGTHFVPRLHRCISRTSAGNLVGGVIYTNYNPRAMTLHTAAWDKHWLNRDMLWTIFAYPFLVLEVEKLVAFVPSTNEHALEFDKRIGFVEETKIRDVVPDGDMVILSMRREHCRWLNWQPRYLKTAALESGHG